MTSDTSNLLVEFSAQQWNYNDPFWLIIWQNTYTAENHFLSFELVFFLLVLKQFLKQSKHLFDQKYSTIEKYYYTFVTLLHKIMF